MKIKKICQVLTVALIAPVMFLFTACMGGTPAVTNKYQLSEIKISQGIITITLDTTQITEQIQSMLNLSETDRDLISKVADMIMGAFETTTTGDQVSIGFGMNTGDYVDLVKMMAYQAVCYINDVHYYCWGCHKYHVTNAACVALGHDIRAIDSLGWDCRCNDCTGYWDAVEEMLDAVPNVRLSAMVTFGYTTDNQGNITLLDLDGKEINGSIDILLGSLGVSAGSEKIIISAAGDKFVISYQSAMMGALIGELLGAFAGFIGGTQPLTLSLEYTRVA
jgi:hypothetical protein